MVVSFCVFQVSVWVISLLNKPMTVFIIKGNQIFLFGIWLDSFSCHIVSFLFATR